MTQGRNAGMLQFSIGLVKMHVSEWNARNFCVVVPHGFDSALMPLRILVSAV